MAHQPAPVSFEESLKGRDVVQDEIRRMRPGLYRRLRGEVTLNPESPLVHPPPHCEPTSLFGRIDAEVPFNPLLPRQK